MQTRTVSKLLWVRGLAFGLLVIVGLFVIGADRTNAPAKAHYLALPPEVPVDPATLRRPQMWIDAPAPTRADPVSFQQYKETIQGLAKREHLKPQDRIQLLTDAETRKRVANAQRLIAAVDDLPGAWRWEETRAVIADIGSGVALADGAAMMPDDTTAGAMYDGTQNAMLVWPVQLQIVDDEELAGILVHETTHAIVHRRMLAMSGLTDVEETALSGLCSDSRVLIDFTHEALAFINQGRWFSARGLTGKRPQDRYDIKVIEAATAASDGALAHRQVFGNLLWTYIWNEFFNDRKGKGGLTFRCSVPRVMRGPYAGQLFFPSDVAPDVLVPLLDAIHH